MAPLIYGLCALTSFSCAVLLWRGYLRSTSRLLFWSACCFLLLTVNNVLLVFDKVIWPVEVDLAYWRLSAALLAVLLLLFGLIWDED
jgi:hypothetical protein